ncbi:MAG: ABC transporter ATP-binding protein [Synergistaceae bacterium]|jgi:peptide/nickel transport system ATP-binding protein|nr:ABC transporter ATP-binding protein [Synergistaceae bacterium]
MTEKNVMNNVLEVKDLTVRFKSKASAVHTAVDGVSLSLAEGDTLAIVGESGSGKTTLMKAIMGFVERGAGSVNLFGRSTDAISFSEYNELRRMCGYIQQDPYGAIPPGLTVLDSVIEPAVIAKSSMGKNERRERAISLLNTLGLESERIFSSRAVNLSGGQRQRVGIARALMLSPRLLLCDEPTSMQDVSTRGEIIEILDDCVTSGMSMLFITHDLMLAGRVAKNIIVMKDGKICEAGSTEEVLSSPKHPYTKILAEAVPKIEYL